MEMAYLLPVFFSYRKGTKTQSMQNGLLISRLTNSILFALAKRTSPPEA